MIRFATLSWCYKWGEILGDFGWVHFAHGSNINHCSQPIRSLPVMFTSQYSCPCVIPCHTETLLSTWQIESCGSKCCMTSMAVIWCCGHCLTLWDHLLWGEATHHVTRMLRQFVEKLRWRGTGTSCQQPMPACQPCEWDAWKLDPQF